MDRLNVWKFAAAAAATFASLSALCALAAAIAPDATLAVFNSWFHGLDLRLLVPPGGRPMTAGQVVSGIVSAAAGGFVGGALLAGCYNAFGSKAPRWAPDRAD